MPVRFLLALAFWTLVGNALLANSHVEAALVIPFSQWQGELAARYIVGGPLAISLVPGCSGLDVMSLCVAALLSYPVAWRRRLLGAGLGVALLFVLNILRISALAVTSQTPAFQTLHVYVWPALLVAVTLGWIVLWIKTAERRGANAGTGTGTGRRFVLWSAALLVVYVIAVQLLTDALVLDRAAKAVAGMAASLLTALGTEASVTGNVLRARHVEYLITPECITTPLIALYLAAVFASPIGWRTRVMGIVACLPVFVSLAVLRLLTVALPPLILGTDLILTHAFHQIVAGVVAVIAFAVWTRGERSRRQASGIALLAGTVVAVAASITGLGYARSLAGALHFAHLPVAAGVTPIAGDGDVQAATMVMPIFQVALFLALAAVGWRRPAVWHWATGLVVLIGSQLAVLAAMGWMESSGVPPLSPLLVRGWAVAIPALLAVAMFRATLHAPRTQIKGVFV